MIRESESHSLGHLSTPFLRRRTDSPPFVSRVDGGANIGLWKITRNDLLCLLVYLGWISFSIAGDRTRCVPSALCLQGYNHDRQLKTYGVVDARW
jgi:hypothetical protein